MPAHVGVHLGGGPPSSALHLKLKSFVHWKSQLVHSLLLWPLDGLASFLASWV